jgi:hypothetical protein
MIGFDRAFARIAACVIPILSAAIGGCEKDESTPQQGSARPRRPPRAALKAKPDVRNVIFISIDTLRADHLALKQA